MTTRRSMNKMELRAHTSVHNLIEVGEDKLSSSDNFTRDRLGKKHALGPSEIPSKSPVEPA